MPLQINSSKYIYIQIFKGMDSHFFIKMEIICGIHTTSNFSDLNRLFFKLHLIDHPYKILAKSEMFKTSN